jgi:hypothetical protein
MPASAGIDWKNRRAARGPPQLTSLTRSYKRSGTRMRAAVDHDSFP